MRVIGFGSYDRTKHPRIGIVLDGLRELQVEVDELNAPLGFSTAERVRMLGKPWLGYRFVCRLLWRWLQLCIGRLRLRHRPDAVVVGYLGHFDVVLARLLFPKTLIVLDLLIFAADTAADRGVRPGPKLRALAALDRLAIGCADIVILDTDEHLELMPAGQRHKAVVVDVGSPANWFSKPVEQRPDGPLRVVFYGLFTPLQGAPTIGAAVALLAAGPPMEITMIGSGQDLAETRQLAGIDPGPAQHPVTVRWVSWVEPESLPAIVAGNDVCLGIFGTSAKGRRVTPNKVYQGAAAGCAIVTSDTPPQRRCLGEAARYVEPGNPAALAEALRSLAASPEQLTRLKVAGYTQADQHFRPAQIALPLLEAIRARELAY